jgi:sulfur carrier protein
MRKLSLVVYSQEIDHWSRGLSSGAVRPPGSETWIEETMKLHLNGEKLETEAGITVKALLLSLDLGNRRVAVAVNGEISPRTEHAKRVLEDGDAVEVIHAVAGG